MRKLILIFIFILALFGAIATAPGQASAHVLKVDGNIGSTLHVDPADNPVVGGAATFYFEIKDKQNKFTPENCLCTVVIATSEGEAVHTEQLFTQNSNSGLSSPLLQYVFQKGGVYTVSLAGSPKTDGVFQQFKLEYTVRVENAGTTAGENASGSSDVWLYVGLGAVVLAALLLMAWQRKKKGAHVSALLVLFGVFSAGSMLLYTAHLFEAFTTVPVHHHIAGESGHAENVAHAVHPHTQAVTVTPFFLAYSESLFTLARVSASLPETATYYSFDNRAPPHMVDLS